MKHLLMVGGIVALVLAVAASQHSPPVPNQALTAPAAMVAPAPELVSAPLLDGYVIKVTASHSILVPAASLRDLEATVKARPWRPSNVKTGYTLSPKHNAATHTLTSKHESNSAQRGWGFL